MNGPASGFLTASRAPAPPGRRLPGALTLSLGTHAGALIVLVLLANGRTAPMMVAGVEPVATRLIWMAAAPEPDGGIGGGGQDDADRPPRAARVRGEDPAAVSVSPPPSLEAAPAPREPAPAPMPIAPGLEPSASGLDTLAGVLQPIAVNAPASRGPGTDDGAGGGPGDGIGPGGGHRIGAGGPGLTGDGPGGRGGAFAPQILVKIPPEYTHEAMRAKVQGTAVLEAVVLPDGTVGDVRIVRSLDAVFGLDQQVIRAVKAWRFAPGTRGGQPIPMIVTIELTFTLR